MFLQRLSDLSLTDLESLRDNKVSESKHLEFKQEAVGGSDSDRKEFVADVTAFANAAGGDIVFGIAEGDDATAEQIVGIAFADKDQEERRLSDMIRNGTEPRFTDFEFKWIEISSSKSALIVRARRSWAGPHRVTLKGHDKFYVRDTKGKHPMNVDELRDAFTRSSMLVDRIRSFRKERIKIIQEGDTPAPISEDAKLVVHIIPLVSFTDPPFLEFGQEVPPPPLGSTSGYNWLYTLEGQASYSGPEYSAEPVRAYSLQFRSGIVEAVSRIGEQNEKGEKGVFVGMAEQEIVERLPSHLKYLIKKGVGAPYYVFITIVDVRDYTIFHQRRSTSAVRSLKRDVLYFPERLITEAEINQPIGLIMRPIFDLMWNSFGLPHSFNYDQQGQFKPWT